MSAFKDSGHHWWQQCSSCEMAWFIGDEPCDGEETEATCRRCDAPTPPAEPTTAEAFARVRHEIASHTDTEENITALDALALLERRMGEMERETERLRDERQAHLLERQRLNALGDPYSR